MDMQFIFGNPKGSKKSALRKKRKAGKIKGRGLSMAKKKKKSAKKHTSSKKYASTKKVHRKGKGKKNPYQAIYVKKPAAGSTSGKVQSRRGPVLLTPKESTDLKAKILSNRHEIEALARKPHNTLTSSDKMKLGRLKSQGKKLKKIFTHNAAKDFEFKKKSETWLKDGFEYLKSELIDKPAGGSKVAKKKTSKKKSSKKKSAKKHTAKKAAPKKHKPKKHHTKKKASSKKKAGKKKRVGKVITFHKKGSKARLKWKKDSIVVQANPKKSHKRRKPAHFSFSKKRKSLTVTSGKSKFKLFKNPGGAMKEYAKIAFQHDLKEVGELVVGGGLYKTTNLLMAKYGKVVYDPLLKVPVLGEALPSLLFGALLNTAGHFLASKSAAAGNALKFVGTGLVSASAVTMGAAAAAQINKSTGLLNGLEGDFQGLLEGGDFSGDFQGLLEGDGDYEMSGLLEGSDFGDDLGADFGNDFGDELSGEEMDGIMEGDSMC